MSRTCSYRSQQRRRGLPRTLCFLVGILAASSLFAQADAPAASPSLNLYVATDGNDTNSGTISDPWRTVQKAASTAGPGDTVNVRGGVYNESIVVDVSGEEGSLITFRSKPGEVAIIDGTGLVVPTDKPGLILIEDRHHLAIENFEIRKYSTSTSGRVPTGIRLEGQAHNVRIISNTIHHIVTNAPVDADLLGADAHGIAVYGTSATVSIHDILIDDNELHDLALGSSEALVLNGNVERFTVTNNRIHNCHNIAIDAIGFEETAPDPTVDQARDGLIAGNLIFDISTFNNPAYGDDYSAGGIYVDGGRDITIERNTIARADIGIEIASEHQGRATSGVTVRSNFVYDNRIAGISLGGYDTERGSTEDCVIVNNTLYNNDTRQDGNGEVLLQFDTRNNVIRNNILIANEQALLIGNAYTQNTGNVVDSNLYFVLSGSDPEFQWRDVYYATFTEYTAGSGNDAASSVADPGLSDPSKGDLHLTSSSPAIDAGTNLPSIGDFDIDGDARVISGAIDLGADETLGDSSNPGTASADFNGNGSVDFADFVLFAGAFGSTDPRYDLDLSGTVDFLDFITFASSFGR